MHSRPHRSRPPRRRRARKTRPTGRHWPHPAGSDRARTTPAAWPPSSACPPATGSDADPLRYQPWSRPAGLPSAAVWRHRRRRGPGRAQGQQGRSAVRRPDEGHRRDRGHLVPCLQRQVRLGSAPPAHVVPVDRAGPREHDHATGPCPSWCRRRGSYGRAGGAALVDRPHLRHPRRKHPRDSDLDELGVDSLASAEIVTDLEIRLGRDLPVYVLRRLGSARTVGDFATAMQGTFDQAGDGSSR
jgi:acyl carrier protein